MEIKTLKTTNFKRLGTGEHTFTKGLNFISGDNGKGKSTLLRAIATAMFGIQMLPGTSEDVATWGFNSWALELEFSVGSDNYLITRNKSNAALSKNDKLEANGNTPVTKYMEDLLGISYKDYSLLIHSRQGETAYILNYGATALLRKVEEFAGVEIVEKVEKEASAMARQLNFQLENQICPSDKTLEELAVKQKEFQSKIEVLEAELSRMKVLEKPVEPEMTVRQIMKLRQEYLDSLSELKSYEERRAQLLQEAADLEEVKEPSSQNNLIELITDTKTALESTRASNTRVERNQVKKEQFEARLASIELNPLTADQKEKKRELEGLDYTPNIEDLFKVNATIEERINGYEKQLKEGKCSSCGTILTDFNPDEVAEKIEELKTSKLKNTQAIEKYTDMRTEVSNALKELNSLESAYLKDLEDRKQLEAELNSLEVGSIVDVHPLESKLQQLNSEQSIHKELVKQYENYLSAKDKIVKRITRMEEPEVLEEISEEQVKVVEEQWVAYQAADTEFTLARSEARNIELQIEVEDKQLAASKIEEKKVKDFIDNQEKQGQEYDTAKSLSDYLRKKRADYLSQVWDGIVHYASTFLNSSTGGWLEEVAVKEGKFLFREDGAWVPVIEASGAQSAFVGAALRYGLNKALYRGQTFLAFDEPTEAMTEENARNLIAGLATAAEQVLIITHKESDQGLADNIIEVL